MSCGHNQKNSGRQGIHDKPLGRTYREDGKVKNETLTNLSHLSAPILEVVKAGMSGQAVGVLSQDLACIRSLPHEHVAAVVGTMRSSVLIATAGISAHPEAEPLGGTDFPPAPLSGIETRSFPGAVA